MRTRWALFVLTALAVAVPLLVPLGLPLRVTKEVQSVYDAIQALPEGSLILLSFDFGAASLPEMEPMSRALLRHCFNRNLKVVGLALLAEGAGIGNNIMRSTASEYGKGDGVDYLFLGYKPRPDAAILGIGEDLRRVFPADHAGRSTEDAPILEGVNNYGQIAMVVSMADDDMPIVWINYAGARYGATIACGATAVMVTSFYPYLPSRQLVGLIGGLRGAAEYERLVGRTGSAARGMDAQSVAHALVLFAIVAANLHMLFRKRREV
jgi:hypothetical protein